MVSIPHQVGVPSLGRRGSKGEVCTEHAVYILVIHCPSQRRVILSHKPDVSFATAESLVCTLHQMVMPLRMSTGCDT